MDILENTPQRLRLRNAHGCETVFRFDAARAGREVWISAMGGAVDMTPEVAEIVGRWLFVAADMVRATNEHRGTRRFQRSTSERAGH